MRASTAFNRVLGLSGASVTGVRFDHEGVIVAIRLRRRRRVCSGCGQVCRATHDTQACRWRHLDLGAQRCYLVCSLRRVKCPDCGVRLEAVPWARSARFTRDFEDVVAFLAQQMAKSPIARLMRIDWETVGRIVERVVAERLDPGRLAGLRMIGVDEVSYRKRHRYLTVVADHDSGRIVWCAKGRNAAHAAGLLRPARGAQAVDPGGLDRHVRRLWRKPSASRSRTPRSRSTREPG